MNPGAVHRLSCHPSAPPSGPIEVFVTARRDSNVLLLSYETRGRLKLPPPATAAFREGLWRTTCCEAFVARPGEPGYLEYNFSPSGEWACWRFTGYREGMSRFEEDVSSGIVSSPGSLRLETRINVKPGPLRLGLCVVAEEPGGAISYWALAHPAPKPDFHHSGGFALELA